jgi:phospholipase/carboxylesterase
VIGHRERPAAGDPEGALVLMHGRGADENDLFPLFDMLDPDRRMLGLSPRGPLSLPPGGAHWYAVAQIGYPDSGTFWATYPALTDWLDSTLETHGLDHSQTVLGGFSQGGVMSYALGLGKDRPAPRAIVAMSSFIPTVEGLELDLERDVPFSIAHGTDDPIIGVEWGRDAQERLTANGYPMGHTVHPDFIEEARRRV